MFPSSRYLSIQTTVSGTAPLGAPKSKASVPASALPPNRPRLPEALKEGKTKSQLYTETHMWEGGAWWF